MVPRRDYDHYHPRRRYLPVWKDFPGLDMTAWLRQFLTTFPDETLQIPFAKDTTLRRKWRSEGDPAQWDRLSLIERTIEEYPQHVLLRGFLEHQWLLNHQELVAELEKLTADAIRQRFNEGDTDKTNLLAYVYLCQREELYDLFTAPQAVQRTTAPETGAEETPNGEEETALPAEKAANAKQEIGWIKELYQAVCRVEELLKGHTIREIPEGLISDLTLRLQIINRAFQPYTAKDTGAREKRPEKSGKKAAVPKKPAKKKPV